MAKKTSKTTRAMGEPTARRATKKNFMFPPATVEALERLMSRTTAATESEAVKRAIQVYDTIVANGGRFTIPGVDGERETHVA